MFIDKFFDQTTCNGWLKFVHSLVYIFYEAIQRRKNPPVNFRSLPKRHILLSESKTVYVCVQCEELISVVQRAEEFTLHFFDAVNIKPEIVPRRRVCNQVPPRGISSKFFNRGKRIHDIPQSLTHFVTLAVEYQSIRYASFVRDRIKHQCGDRMKSVEPSSCLVDAFCDKIRGKCSFKFRLVLKRKMPL